MEKQGPFVSKNEVIMTLSLVLYFVISVTLMHRIPGLIDWLGIFIFAYSVYTWKKKTQMGWLNPYTIFQLFMLAFNYGQPLMWALGIHRESELGKSRLFGATNFIPTREDLLKAQVYTCLAMLIFHFGVMCITKKNRKIAIERPAFQKKELENIRLKKTMRIVFGILLLIIAPVAIAYRWYEVQIARSYGYIALYYGSHNTQSGYIHMLLYLFFPALVGFLISNDYSRRSRYIAYGLFGIYAVLGVLAGDRGSWFYPLTVLLWLHTFYKKTPIRTYIVYGIAGIIGLYIVNVFISVRDNGLATITGKDFFNSFQAKNSPIVDGFFEMGGAMGIITFFLHMGNGIYPYGNTYLTSILGMVSSRLLPLLGIKQVLLANWFSQEYLGISWGTGFSMIGEAYVNGGYVGGLIYMLVFGCLLGKLLNYSRDTSLDNPRKLFVITAGLNVILGFIRGALYLTLKELFYGVFIPILFVQLVTIMRRRNRS